MPVPFFFFFCQYFFWCGARLLFSEVLDVCQLSDWVHSEVKSPTVSSPTIVCSLNSQGQLISAFIMKHVSYVGNSFQSLARFSTTNPWAPSEVGAQKEWLFSFCTSGTEEIMRLGLTPLKDVKQRVHRARKQMGRSYFTPTDNSKDILFFLEI